ncbi:MAG: hypothetical protein KGJ13_09010, partial [Patescibacteria group bacterium]|nr:hypothetical protein [Patescibacteria group bacterium]
MVKYDPEQHTGTTLERWLDSVRDDPLAFVQGAFPWRKEGTELSTHDGPDEWQAGLLADIRDGLKNLNEAIQGATASGHGVGKLQRYDDFVETPAGLRQWREIGPGDTVFGADGCPTNVTACQHFKNVPMYRVSFDDGSSLDVSSGHLWNVRGRQERRKGIVGWRTLETIQILEEGVKRPNGVSLTRHWEIPIQGAAQFEEREVDIHPYFMGVWLGDGHKGTPIYTKPYVEIADKIRSLGYDVNVGSNGAAHRVMNITHLLTDPVFQCGSSERYIPEDFKYNSVANRMALFEGLCDTDGEANQSGSIGYSTTSRRLAEDVLWLARSLGCKAKIQNTVKKGWYPDKNGDRVNCRDCWRLTINAPFNPFTVKHRRDSYKPSEKRYLSRWIDSIEPIENADGQCITVAAPDGLYLANQFIVTHNSALVAWLILWSMATMQDTRGVITANTEVQLRTKTWPELARWLRLFIGRDMFDYTATAIFSSDKDHEKTWRIDAVTWSETRTEAFAGLHNQGKRIIVVYDEASAIPDIIWETTEGALTDKDTQIIWCVFGNPTRNTGRFKECFGRFRHRWITRQVDSRTSRFTNKDQIKEWVTDYGEDSDFVRVRVRGVFPRAGTMQFIPTEMAESAMSHDRAFKLDVTILDPMVMGCDIARYGDDATVIAFRRGRDAVSIPWVTMRGADTVQVAGRIAALIAEFKPDAVFIDDGSFGSGVLDQLRHLGHPVIGVTFGAAADHAVPSADGKIAYANKRAEIWGS